MLVYGPYICGKNEESAILEAVQSYYHLLKEAAEDFIMWAWKMAFCWEKLQDAFGSAKERSSVHAGRGGNNAEFNCLCVKEKGCLSWVVSTKNRSRLGT
jgi:hypothetical protein